MHETPTLRKHLMALADLLDEPRHLVGPDAEQCSAADHPEAWADLTVGWSRVLAAARTIQARHAEDTHDAVLSQCCDAAREASTGELRWVWARLVHQYVEGVAADE